MADLGISKVFDIQLGMLTFLGRSIKCQRMHREANGKVMELFDRIINGEHGAKVAEYAPAVVDVMLQFVLSGAVSALEKERATIVIHSLVRRRLCAGVPMTELLAQLLQVFHNTKATSKCACGNATIGLFCSVDTILRRPQFCGTCTNCSACWRTTIRSACAAARTSASATCS